MWLMLAMAQAIGNQNRGRLWSLAGATLVHAVLGLALMLGLQGETIRFTSDSLKLIDLREEAPPPPPLPEEPPIEPLNPASEGAPAPPRPKARASPLVVPPSQVRLDAKPVLVVAPVPATGATVASGMSEREGPGTGAGGQGTGTGAGGQGAGSGKEAEDPVIRTRRIEGNFTSRDYPREASRAGIEGTTVARLTIGANGRVSECIVRASSGSEALDRTTCGIILSRFRFEPARDTRGEATTDTVEWEQNWSLRREGPEMAEAQCRAQADRIRERRAARAEFFSCMAALGWARR